MRIDQGIVLAIFWMFLVSVAASAQVPGKMLIVIAHPDDEYYLAATTYRMAVQLGGTVDEVIITNGESGFHYSTLAEPFYGKALTTEAVGRKELPAIRKEETLRAGKVLGIRNHYFLDQKDEAFTTDGDEGLKRLWDADFIANTIADLIKGQRYQYVFAVLPRSTTHGHHQAASIFAARAIQMLPAALRPVLFGFDTDVTDYIPLPSIPESHSWPAAYSFAFNRNAALGFHNALSYQVIVSWMIAEHKSQGLLQTWHNKDPKEYVWVDSQGGLSAQARASSLFQLINSDSKDQLPRHTNAGNGVAKNRMNMEQECESRSLVWEKLFCEVLPARSRQTKFIAPKFVN